MDNTTYYQINREIMLNRAKYYYENDKERQREQARNNYRNLSEEDKEKNREYAKKIDIEIRLKKKNIKNKDIEKQKSLGIIIKNNVFTIESIYLNETDGDKSLIVYI